MDETDIASSFSASPFCFFFSFAMVSYLSLQIRNWLATYNYFDGGDQ